MSLKPYLVPKLFFRSKYFVFFQTIRSSQSARISEFLLISFDPAWEGKYPIREGKKQFIWKFHLPRFLSDVDVLKAFCYLWCWNFQLFCAIFFLCFFESKFWQNFWMKKFLEARFREKREIKFWQNLHFLQVRKSRWPWKEFCKIKNFPRHIFFSFSIFLRIFIAH